MIKFDFETFARRYLNNQKCQEYYQKYNVLEKRFIEGDLKYWTEQEEFISNDELNKLKDVANYIKNNCDVFVVIGIGGSYMGSKAVIEALSPIYNRRKPELIFLGTNLTSNEYNEFIEYVKDKEIMVNVISKSGTTLEPSIAFDVVLKLMKEKYTQEELIKHVYVTTDKEKGILRQTVTKEGYTSFIVPDKIGGRFSVLTPVGLLPIAVAGIDVDLLLSGAKEAINYLDVALDYSINRQLLYEQGMVIESFTIYDGRFTYFSEWLKQLFAETQGKEGKGILPIANINTRDLHSLGQFLQEGKNIIFETVLGVKKSKDVMLDNYSMSLNELNTIAREKVAQAHYNGYTPSLMIEIEELNEKSLGLLLQFFIYSAIIGALILEVNPFDQPGVQEYKRLINEELEK